MEAAIAWRDKWDEALAEAKQKNRPLLVEFYMEG